MDAKILIVDDDPLLLQLVEHILEKEGYETVTAMEGEEALKQVETENPDLVILDVMLPGSTRSKSAGDCGANRRWPPYLSLC